MVNWDLYLLDKSKSGLWQGLKWQAGVSLTNWCVGGGEAARVKEEQTAYWCLTMTPNLLLVFDSEKNKAVDCRVELEAPLCFILACPRKSPNGSIRSHWETAPSASALEFCWQETAWARMSSSTNEHLWIKFEKKLLNNKKDLKLGVVLKSGPDFRG